MAAVRRWFRDLLFLFPRGLARLGFVERRKAEAAFDLAVPAMVTGGMRTVLRAADFFMVSMALGHEAVAALELGFQYYFIAFGLALALTSGTISVVSRFKGAGRDAAADRAVKQSLWLSFGLSVPFTVGSWLYAEAFVGVLTDNPDTIAMGATYLRIVMLAVVFRFWSMIAARALAGSGDTRTPMYIRTVTLPTNVVLNAVLIFGLAGFPMMGIAGAAWGTVIANTLSGVLFFVALVSGRFDIRLRLGGPHWDGDIAREIVRVAVPLSGTRLARTFGRFPFLFVLGVLGTQFVAAYAIGRRVMLMAMMPSWGYSTAASTLVGQRVGAGEREDAADFGWQTVRIAIATQLLIAAAIFVAARPIAASFGAENTGLTVAFIRVFGVTVAGFAVARTLRGGLRGAGDTRWPFYGSVLGTYVVRLPLAALALPAGFAVSLGGLTVAPGLGLGMAGVVAAIVGDIYARALVNAARFRSERWWAVGRPASAD